jgi:ERCC4-type nuclease
MPTLTVDLREQKEIIDGVRDFVPRNFQGWEVDARMIEVGDFSVGNALGIEHKAPSDFLGSLASGRLFAQAEELKGAYERAVILVDGNMPELLFDRWNRIGARATRGAIASLYCHFGVPVLFSGPGRSDFYWTIMQLAEKSQGDSSFFYSPLRRKASSEEHGAHLLGGLPGIGRKRAQAILAHFGTPLKALNHYRDWGNLDGIGKGTVAKVGAVLEPAPDGAAPPAPAE